MAKSVMQIARELMNPKKRTKTSRAKKIDDVVRKAGGGKKKAKKRAKAGKGKKRA